MKIRVKFSGRQYQRQGEFPDTLELAGSATLSDAMQQLEHELGESLNLESTWLVVVDGEHLGSVADFRDQALSDGAELMLLAPVAGG